jgi:MarR family transcriptional regulator, organic hydroperoxide resistance regulator
VSNDQTPVDDAERIAELFERTTRATWRAKPAKKMKSIAFELTLAQGRCLRAIARMENCTLGELSQHLDISPSTASPLIDRLVRAGLVRREGDPQDRRTVRLRLSAKGRQMFDRHKEERREHMKVFLDHLTEEQRKAMLNALEALDDVVNQVEQAEQTAQK